MPAVKTKQEPKAITDEVRDFFRKHFENNEPPKTRDDFEKLRKMSYDIPNLKKESRPGISKTALLDIFKEKGFEIPDGIGNMKKSASTGSIEVTFEGAGKKVEQVIDKTFGTNLSNQNQNHNNQGFGIFQQNQQSQIPHQQTQMPFPGVPTQSDSIMQRKVLSESEKTSNKRFIKQTIQLPKTLYAKLGIIEDEEISQQEKPKKWGDEVDEWAESLADWCNENGYSFPAKMEMIMIGVSGLLLFVMPVMMKIIGSRSDKKRDEKKRKEPTELDKILEKEQTA